MSDDPYDPFSDASRSAAPIVARAANAGLRADHRLETAIDDFFLPDDARLDDRTRTAIAILLGDVVASIERELAAHVGRAMTGGDLVCGVLPRLIASGLLRDPDLMAELLGRTRQDMLSAALIENAGHAGREVSLLVRLANCPDGVVSSAATAFLVSESHRRGATGGRTELPPMLHQRIVWWVAAAMRERHPPSTALDRALAEAAIRSVSAQDGSDRLEVVAGRLAAAIDARPEELGELLVDALGDGRAALFVAAIAHATELDYIQARAIALDPDGDRLWLVLRAHGLDRPTIARIGLALADADRRRDIEAFADDLDSIVAIETDGAARAIAPMRLHPDFRNALNALARSARP